MNETISKVVLSGIGFASLAQDAIRDTAQHLVDQSTLTEEEGRRVVEEFQRRFAKTHTALEKKVNTTVRKALKQLELVPAKPKKRVKASAKSTTHRTRKGTKRAARTH